MSHTDVIRDIAKADTDISDHLETIYKVCVDFKPHLIVELGVRGGESTRIFDFVNKEVGSKLISVDIDFCKYENITNGTFYRADDVMFGKMFKGLTTDPIDVLFIDTSHLYQHTKEEINTWFPLLNNKALAIFHDTNLNTQYFHRNGNVGAGWNNERGVIRAIEEYFGIKVDETTDCELDVTKDGSSWHISHKYLCCGLTICYKSLQNE